MLCVLDQRMPMVEWSTRGRTEETSVTIAILSISGRDLLEQKPEQCQTDWIEASKEDECFAEFDWKGHRRTFVRRRWRSMKCSSLNFDQHSDECSLQTSVETWFLSVAQWSVRLIVVESRDFGPWRYSPTRSHRHRQTDLWVVMKSMNIAEKDGLTWIRPWWLEICFIIIRQAIGTCKVKIKNCGSLLQGSIDGLEDHFHSQRPEQDDCRYWPLECSMRTEQSVSLHSEHLHRKSVLLWHVVIVLIESIFR
jgi:hypothetical protein